MRSVGGLALGTLLLVGYVALVGVADVRRVLWTVPPRRLLSLLLVGGVPLLLWGAGLSLVFDRLDVSVRLPNSVLLYAAAGFCNAVTPFGQAGGDPVAAVFLGLFGVAYLGSLTAVGGSLSAVAVFVTGLSTAVALGLVVAWTYRSRLVELVAATLTPLARAGARVVPGVRPPSRAALERRGRRFVAAVDRLASDPRRLALEPRRPAAARRGVNRLSLVE